MKTRTSTRVLNGDKALNPREQKRASACRPAPGSVASTRRPAATNVEATKRGSTCPERSARYRRYFVDGTR